MRMTSIAGLVMVSAAATVAMVSTATADSASDRAAISDGLSKLSSNASALAAAAKKSEDRAVRKKFAPKAEELSDDLASLAKRASKDVALASIGKEAADIGRDAAALIELAGIERVFYASTNEDAFKYGDFDDSMIYGELKKPVHDRSIRCEQIMQAAYGNGTYVSDRTIDSHIRNLRAKFAEAGCASIIETVHGVGFRLGTCR